MRKQITHGLQIFPFAIALLTGCGGGEPIEVEVSFDDSEIDTTISGSVGDGPIVGAEVDIRDQSGQVIGSQTSNELANFQVTITVRGNQFPLTAEVTDGTDLVTGAPPDYPLVASIMRPGSNQIANLNPFSTLSVAITQRMAGGLTESNVNIAAGAVLDALSFGLDRNLVPNPMTTEITAGNIATLIKASEAFSETARRTRDALMVVGLVTSASEVLDSVAADMVDGIVDGRGAAGTSARIAAVWNLVSAQVLLEAIINRLHVGGIDATVAMDIAIQQVMPNNPAVPLTSSVTITTEMLAQLRTVLDAAQVFSGDPTLASMLQMLDLIQPGADPANVEVLLPDGSSDALNAAISQISIATPTEHEIVNASVRQESVGPNRAPSISGTPPTSVVQGQLYEFTPDSNDPDSDPLVFSVSNLPSWANFNAATGGITGVPGSSDTGSYPNITIGVSDGALTDSLGAFAIAVGSTPNEPPVISGSPPSQVMVGNPYDFTPTAADPEGNPLAFAITNRPPWASFDNASGRLSGAPAAAGAYTDITISVTDGTSAVSLSPFSITVIAAANQPPTAVAGVNQTVNEGVLVILDGTGSSDPDGDSLTYQWSQTQGTSVGLANPAGPTPTFTSPTGLSQDETLVFALVVNDGEFNGNDSVNVTVRAANPSAGNIGPLATVNASSETPGTDQFAVKAVDGVADGWPGDFTREWASNGEGAGAWIELNWASFYTIDRIVIYDRPNSSDHITGATLSFSDGSTVAVAATDNTGGPTEFVLASRVINSVRLAVNSVGPGTASIGLAEFEVFGTLDQSGNQPPVISGTPPTNVTAGSNYDFTPTASDPNGDLLVFSVSNLPAWANFNPNTGHLSGVPSSTDVGTYPNISIRVSDGALTVALPVFTIDVAGIPTTSATLSWTPPTEHTDGSPLLDLSGYKIYIGPTEGNYSELVNLANPGLTTYVTDLLPPGTYYFVITAYDNAGTESVYSNVASKTIN